MKYLPGIYFFLFILGQSAFPQNKLRITYSYFGIIKKYEIFEGTLLNYKVKGNRDFLTSRVVALRDSSIIFESEDAILLNQLKLVCVKKKNYHNRLFQKIFFRGAVGYPLLASGNNAVNGITPFVIGTNCYGFRFFTSGMGHSQTVGHKKNQNNPTQNT